MHVRPANRQKGSCCRLLQPSLSSTAISTGPTLEVVDKSDGGPELCFVGIPPGSSHVSYRSNGCSKREPLVFAYYLVSQRGAKMRLPLM